MRGIQGHHGFKLPPQSGRNFSSVRVSHSSSTISRPSANRISKIHPDFPAFLAALATRGEARLVGETRFVADLLDLGKVTLGRTFSPTTFAQLFDPKQLLPLDLLGNHMDSLALARGVGSFFEDRFNVNLGSRTYSFTRPGRFLRYFGVDNFSTLASHFTLQDLILLCGKWGDAARAATVGNTAAILGLDGFKLVVNPIGLEREEVSWAVPVSKLATVTERLDYVFSQVAEQGTIEKPDWLEG